ncbi:MULTISPECIES: glutamine synthetase family protein [unclassified Mycolicibacterium]|uniref:glutamine synthetase family protein n=1 Tax=unclassified Mycolicibacterium TaxID=2636767 RepID=UPI0012DE69A5|nr:MULTISPECIES: glutamine synthetase family protein [unclassified Mycolicibacterium]MUL82558.1 glutamine synthetase [Mycolicibacterium sp. CBMA 329]MUL91310.1 glutamine synthetase [Mycolicibacterium sp. CBMA 331]MUM03167.1 glutamine synthetase [Mycolicibacterium sp. CBMA 334]MUM41734.1 glutamine synthetase [Mycolicibacterium sp. CBMA 247]MUM47265.1 glutamine synthetase [Mycolicibacterium sp. CBMA 294]
MSTTPPVLALDRFEELAAAGEITTVICAAPDPYGRLVGKRLTIPAFRSLGLQGRGVNASSFIFAVDLEMNPLDLAVSNSDNGWVDIRLVPDLATLRRVPWEPSAALVICDAYHMDSDEPLAVAPRTVLRTQLARAQQHGLSLKFASELEFYLAATPPRQAWELGYQNLKMMSDYRSDYQMVQSARDDWFIERIRNQMPEFGVSVESSKPEWGLGQQEVTLDYCDSLEMADRHVLFKYGVKQLAHAADLTVTFMAKPKIDEVGSSCHLHVSLWSADGAEPLCWSDDRHGMSQRFGSFVAGQLHHAADISLMFAPTINSYKRFQPDQFAGTAIAVGDDNRSCAFRLVGSGPSYRVENRIPGADVNPYYAYAATIAAGLDGIDHDLAIPEIFSGNAWTGDDISTVPTSLHRSIDLFAESKMARAAFGDEVFDHLLASAQSELEAFDSHTVTDWESRRYYERV